MSKPDSASQTVFSLRRDYNKWVVNETLEDYALRFTPHGSRKWSELRVGNTAFGAASFLVLEAVGATMLVNVGFVNAFWAILATGLLIFMLSLPICFVAAKQGLDMDLMTRGAGFGYIGSTITSLIYASFTFIFFALEAAIMAYALELGFGIPPAWGYLICAVIVIPLVTHGVTAISKLQAWTQPLWLFLLVLPFVYLWIKQPAVLSGLWSFGGAGQTVGTGFNPYLFGAAFTVGIALVTQIAEQVDYLRFMPARTPENSGRWWAGVVLGGPGWVIPGVFKMLGGAVLAFVALSYGLPIEKVVDPNQLYLIGFFYVFDSQWIAIWVTVLFVVISQLKINVTNTYAGSLAWSNFFARLTHSHPGRVVWVVFNTVIALLLMEMNVFHALGQVLGLYSNIAISWIAAVVADLVINKPLGLSPPGIEFKRSRLYDINPVGVGAMAVASVLSMLVYTGLFGSLLQPFASFVALGTAFLVSPLIAWATSGRYYLVAGWPEQPSSQPTQPPQAAAGTMRCVICEASFELPDMAYCPAYQGSICSLCCVLDARCHDQCKPKASLSAQWHAFLRIVLPKVALPYIESGLGHYLLLMACIIPILGLVLAMLYTHESLALPSGDQALKAYLRDSFLKTFALLSLFSGVIAWWMVLTQQSRRVAQEESNRQTQLLVEEVKSHKKTDEQLQKASQAADQANQAKSRYITAISHELRTPLNSILGYAQILDADDDIPPNRKQAVSVIRKSGDHLLSLIEGTLDIARIEGGKLALDIKPLDFQEFLQQIVGMFELQARNRGLSFDYVTPGFIPPLVRADEKRLRQILINVLGNAIKFTVRGRVTFRVEYLREMATFDIADTGPGISSTDMNKIFEPFVRGSSPQVGGSGVGLTIARMLTDLMGGEMQLTSEVGQGSTFRIRLFLPRVFEDLKTPASQKIVPVGYEGERRRILVVDNEKTDRDLLQRVLEPLGFIIQQAASGYECLEKQPDFKPDVIFMDLAMPGIDGWETIRRLRQQALRNTHIAIISANAFDKGLDNDVGIRPGDFIVKPIQVQELYQWLQTALGLTWVTTKTVAAAHAARVHPTPLVGPDATSQKHLEEAIQLGYLRGILQQLDVIEAGDAHYAEYVSVLRQLARQFQFDAMLEIIRKSSHGAH